MSWYYLDREEDQIIAVTPRVASTSQRRWFDSLPKRYSRIDEGDAWARYERGTKVIATIRDPLERTKSAYRRHKPGFLPIAFAKYVRDRYSWDSHVMPQTQVHARYGIYPTKWRLFEDLITELPRHDNATPREHHDAHKILIVPEFQEWFDEIYQEDIRLYLSLKERQDG